MKTKEVILDDKFKERGIRKGWVNESKQAVLDAMDEYADEKLRLYHVNLSNKYKDVDIKEEIFNFISTHEVQVSKDMKKKDEDIKVRFTTFGNRAGCKAVYDIIQMLDENMKLKVIEKMRINSNPKDMSVNNHACRYSKAMNQPYPRLCVDCGNPEG